MPRTKKKVKPIVKTKVISARVTEAVHEIYTSRQKMPE